MLQTWIRNNVHGLFYGKKNKRVDESLHLGFKSTKDIALSIGQFISVTMAMERSFGEKGLTDFDKLFYTIYFKRHSARNSI